VWVERRQSTLGGLQVLYATRLQAAVLAILEQTRQCSEAGKAPASICYQLGLWVIVSSPTAPTVLHLDMAFSRASFGRGQRAGHRGVPGGRAFRHSPTPSLPRPEGSQIHQQNIVAAPKLTKDFDDRIKIENVEYVTSFNWKETHEPTILVPGKCARRAPSRRESSLASSATHGPPVGNSLILYLFGILDLTL